MQNSRGFYLRRRQNLGFTFLELLVVFSIIGILTGVGFASFVSYSKSQTLDQAVQDLKTGIDQAKFNAVSRVKPAVAPCSDSAPLDRYRIRVCTSAPDKCTANKDPITNLSTDLYEIDAGCVVGGSVSWTSILVSKKRPSSITATTTSTTGSTCGTNGYMQFSTLSGIDGPCTVIVGFTDRSACKTVTVDAGGNTSIGPATCP